MIEILILCVPKVLCNHVPCYAYFSIILTNTCQFKIQPLIDTVYGPKYSYNESSHFIIPTIKIH